MVLLQLVTTSARRAAEARQACDDLQHRWAATSCRTVLLPRADYVLQRAAKRTGRPVGQAQTELDLGSEHLTLTLFDEQAKANISTLYQRVGAQRTERDIQRLGAASATAMGVVLQPTAGGSEDAAAWRFDAWEQVFDRFTPAAMFNGPVRPTPRPVDVLTCWSDGKLNVRRASSAAIEMVVGDVLTRAEIAKLIDDLAQPSDRPRTDVWESTQFSDAQREKLTERLTDKSTTFGLLIRSRDDFQTRYEWNVLRLDLQAGVATRQPHEADRVELAHTVHMAWEAQ